MPTNEKRREVARKLRELAENPGTLFDVLNAMGVECTFEPIDLDRDRKGINRIADLIEPEPERTCNNVGEQMTCSECGAHVYGGSYTHSFVGRNGRRVYTTANKPRWNYCPNCGAKVVNNAD